MFDDTAATAQNSPFDDVYTISRSIVNDLLNAADGHLRDGEVGLCVNALLSTHQNLWGVDSVLWLGRDMMDFTARFEALRKAILDGGHPVYVPKPPDDFHTEDIASAP